MPRRLYQEAILAKAREATGAGTMRDADARVTVDNPLCGDRVTLEIRRSDGKVEDVAHNVRGCVLCQAAAAVIASRARGTEPDQLAAIEDAVRAMLLGDADLPAGAWEELQIFKPVAEHKSRHECVLLPFVALRRAVVEAGLGDPPSLRGTRNDGGER